MKDGKKGIVSSNNIMHHSYFKNQGIYVILCTGTRISPPFEICVGVSV